MTLSLSTVFLVLIVVALTTLALPLAAGRRSAPSLLQAWLITAAGVLIPLVVFLASVVLTPDSKSAVRVGWIDSFHFGKLALTPLVLWALAALYALQVWPARRPAANWIKLGIVNGAVVSSTCFAHGTFIIGVGRNLDLGLGLTIPLYVAVWYGWLTVRLWPAIQVKSVVLSLLGSLPFWIYSIVLSRQVHASLPEGSDCFVVTAASQGHSRLVGPFINCSTSSGSRRINRQLLVFWRFEACWREASPKSHRYFRRFYNVWGYRAAQLLHSPWRADLAYLCLKPLEWTMAVVIWATSHPRP